MNPNDPDPSGSIFSEPPHIPGIQPPPGFKSRDGDALSLTPEEATAGDACLDWDCQAYTILGAFPEIGVEGSAANRRFVDLHRSYEGTLVDALDLAELVMIYPPVGAD